MPCHVSLLGSSLSPCPVSSPPSPFFLPWGALGGGGACCCREGAEEGPGEGEWELVGVSGGGGVVRVQIREVAPRPPPTHAGHRTCVELLWQWRRYYGPVTDVCNAVHGIPQHRTVLVL